jgi:hypothetical protein
MPDTQTTTLPRLTLPNPPQPKQPPAPAPEPLPAAAAPKGSIVLSSKAIKATLTLDAAELIAAPRAPEADRVTLCITVDNRILRTDIASKSWRKALATIRAGEPNGFACILQGKLSSGSLIEAGLQVMPKGPPKG